MPVQLPRRHACYARAMALLGFDCPLCRRPITAGEPVFATSGTWDAGDLSRYCDAAMHQSCFYGWADAERFCRSKFASTVDYRKRTAGIGTIFLLHATVDVLVCLSQSDAMVRIHTAWPRRSWAVPVDAWDAQLDPPSAMSDALWEAIRDALPNARAVTAAAAPHVAIATRFLQAERDHRSAEIREFRKQAQAFEAELRSTGAACSRCGAHSTAHPFTADPDGRRTSFFVCVACHCSTTLPAPLGRFDHFAVLKQLRGSERSS